MRLAAAVVALACASAPAFADCKARIAQTASRVAELRDERDRKLVQYDVQRAGRELREGDEAECAEAMDHAASILDANQTQDAK